MVEWLQSMGQPIEEHQRLNGEINLEKVYKDLKKAYEKTTETEVCLGDLTLEGPQLKNQGKNFLKLDDRAYEIIASYLDIPVPYMSRLNINLKNANVSYWFDYLKEKEASFVHEDEMLVDIKVPRVELIDVIKLVLESMPSTELFNVERGANGTTMDILSKDKNDSSMDSYRGGVRVSVTSTRLIAPVIYPLLVAEGSCAIFGAANAFPALNIMKMTYADILNLTSGRIEDAYSSIKGLLGGIETLSQDLYDNPERMIKLLCKEHGVAERLKKYALNKFSDSGLSELDAESMSTLFGLMGHVQEIKWNSAEKSHKVAGHILLTHTTEERCPKCQNLMDD